jgi:hypothetical protein
MTTEFFTNSMPKDNERLPLLHDAKPIIKILLYTDEPSAFRDDQGLCDLGTMIAHLRAHAPTFARLDIKWMSRNSSDKNHADHKLDAAMLKEYDEVWFFGLHQMSREKFSLIVLKGGPHSELDEDEVKALDNWMKREGEDGARGGGVLMTGDHANPRPKAGSPDEGDRCPDIPEEEFLGLGRALGRHVPRARWLRKWEGAPTACPKNSFNTQVFVTGGNPDDSQLELDVRPQELILKKFDALGNPTSEGYPHPLFFYKGGKYIEVFPDHAHEGAVILPDAFDEDEWPKPKGVQPKPQIVAYGTDKRNLQPLKILAAYNGDCAGVGRIVADSTWHHYLNLNLLSFGSPSQEGTAADQIGQFYANLAVWLSPLSVRREMSHLMFRWLVNNLLIWEELGQESLDVGRTAYALLSQVASPCEIHELLMAAIPDDYCDQFETLCLPERGFPLTPVPSRELILGCIIESYQQDISRIEAAGGDLSQLDIGRVTKSGFERAFTLHASKLMQAGSDAQKILNIKTS